MKIYNPLSQKVETFTSREKDKVTIYVCGITPYDTTHLGHAFVYVFFDTLIRYLRANKYSVDYVQNVTDIDDDVLRKAKEEKRDWRELGEFWTKRFLTDLKTLNVEMPTHYVKATDTMPEIIMMIEELVKKNHAYESGENVYFDVTTFPEYGKLSHYTTDQMKALLKERGGDPDDPHKRNPLDFILWQKSKDDEPSWPSPFGAGRPGWHIECSAMISTHLGEQIDIHGGGHDLIYPHHESEIAQSESFTGKSPFVTYWMHAAMVMYQGEKMSKSLGNLVLVADLLKKYAPNTIRFMLLSHHYRKSWEYEDTEMENAQRQLENIYIALQTPSTGEEIIAGKEYEKQFMLAMENQANIPEALEVLTQLVDIIIREGESKNVSQLVEILQNKLSLLGFLST